jgi:hypothetical protein
MHRVDSIIYIKHYDTVYFMINKVLIYSVGILLLYLSVSPTACLLKFCRSTTYRAEMW